jgi:hypothetical protein
MELIVLKTGILNFDFMHGAGLAIFLAYATGARVTLIDQGLAYHLTIPVQNWPKANLLTLFDELFELPSSELMQEGNFDFSKPLLPLANLEGLLALFYTKPTGPRVCSIADLCGIKPENSALLSKSIEKAKKGIESWRDFLTKKSLRQGVEVSQVIKDYLPGKSKQPKLGPVSGSAITLPMTLDAALAYAPRHPLRNGRISDKTNLTATQPVFAIILTMIGASRFLRVQKIAQSCLNFYAAIGHELIIEKNTTLPIFYSTNLPSSQALALCGLTFYEGRGSLDQQWSGLAYQTFQTQSKQQPISINRGFLDLDWLSKLKKTGGSKLVSNWRVGLNLPLGYCSYPIESLVDTVLSHQNGSWIAHLKEVTRALIRNPRDRLAYRYTLTEIKEITKLMTQSDNSLPLNSILAREKGTLRFGHALRQLGRYNNTLLQDHLVNIEVVQSRDQLIRVLAQAVQSCLLIKAKYKYAIVPDDQDLYYLLEDVNQHGAATVAGLLIILAGLNYPIEPEGDLKPEQAKQVEAVAGKIQEEVNLSQGGS